MNHHHNDAESCNERKNGKYIVLSRISFCRRAFFSSRFFQQVIHNHALSLLYCKNKDVAS